MRTVLVRVPLPDVIDSLHTETPVHAGSKLKIELRGRYVPPPDLGPGLKERSFLVLVLLRAVKSNLVITNFTGPHT